MHRGELQFAHRGIVVYTVCTDSCESVIASDLLSSIRHCHFGISIHKCSPTRPRPLPPCTPGRQRPGSGRRRISASKIQPALVQNSRYTGHKFPPRDVQIFETPSRDLRKRRAREWARTKEKECEMEHGRRPRRQVRGTIMGAGEVGRLLRCAT